MLADIADNPYVPLLAGGVWALLAVLFLLLIWLGRERLNPNQLYMLSNVALALWALVGVITTAVAIICVP